jgi:hypothetical protein
MRRLPLPLVCSSRRRVASQTCNPPAQAQLFALNVIRTWRGPEPAPASGSRPNRSLEDSQPNFAVPMSTMSGTGGLGSAAQAAFSCLFDAVLPGGGRRWASPRGKHARVRRHGYYGPPKGARRWRAGRASGGCRGGCGPEAHGRASAAAAVDCVCFGAVVGASEKPPVSQRCRRQQGPLGTHRRRRQVDPSACCERQHASCTARNKSRVISRDS